MIDATPSSLHDQTLSSYTHSHARQTSGHTVGHVLYDSGPYVHHQAKPTLQTHLLIEHHYAPPPTVTTTVCFHNHRLNHPRSRLLHNHNHGLQIKCPTRKMMPISFRTSMLAVTTLALMLICSTGGASVTRGRRGMGMNSMGMSNGDGMGMSGGQGASPTASPSVSPSAPPTTAVLPPCTAGATNVLGNEQECTSAPMTGQSWYCFDIQLPNPPFIVRSCSCTCNT